MIREAHLGGVKCNVDSAKCSLDVEAGTATQKEEADWQCDEQKA
jgi:hypothetical protein